MTATVTDRPKDAALETLEISELAREIMRDSLIWDAHGGFSCKPDQDLSQLQRWRDVGIDYLSINIGFDIHPWEFTVQTVAAYRHWLLEHSDAYLIVETPSDVLRAKREGKLGVTFDLEGAVSLGRQLSMLETYHRLGVRQMHFAYNLNNEAGGGCQDEDVGLTDFGRALVDEANRLGVVLDCSHSGYRTSLEIIERSKEPVVFSHSNPKSLAEHPRNITNEQIRAVAKNGGLVGVTGVGRFLGDKEARSETFVRAIDLTVEQVGTDHVCLGLDYTWNSLPNQRRFPQFWPAEYYTGNFSYLAPQQMPEVTELLLRRGYREAEIRAIYGENHLRLAEKVWRPAFGKP